jgi:16S rRNA (cytidine1402-2'-O)-methyltransferase
MLYIVSTPIGNLGDMTFRAVEVLKAVDVIACEDTRRTKILCDHYGIRVPLTSYYSYNQKMKGPELLRRLKTGESVALVSDAGTPGISDPGFTLVRDALEAGIRVVSVPGATALISALSISGLPTHRFFFEGFLSPKSGARKKALARYRDLDATIVLYESPHRILKTLKDVVDVLGDIPVACAREVTKKFEEVLRGKASEVLERLTKTPPRGEFVLLLCPSSK